MNALSTHEKMNFFINLLLAVFVVAFVVAIGTEGFVWNIKISVRRLMTPLAWISMLIYLKYLISPGFQYSVNQLVRTVVGYKNRTLKVVVALVSGALVLGLMNGLFPEIRFWNLDSEKSLATAYSGLLLLLAGWLGTYIYFQEKKLGVRSRWMWIPMIALFLYLSLDEVASIHENLGNTENVEKLYGGQIVGELEWLQVYLPLVIVALGYFGYFALGKLGKAKNVLVTLSIAVIFYMVAIGSEAGMLLSDLRGKSWYVLEVVLEEESEMLGTIFFILTFLLYASRLKDKLKNQVLSKPLLEESVHEKNF